MVASAALLLQSIIYFTLFVHNFKLQQQQYNTPTDSGWFIITMSRMRTSNSLGAPRVPPVFGETGHQGQFRR